METAGDKQIQKRVLNAGREFHLCVINVGGDKCEGRNQIFQVGPKREKAKAGKLKEIAEKTQWHEKDQGLLIKRKLNR